MERIETINLKTETDASKRDTASPSTRSTNTADSCTTRISSQALRKNARTATPTTSSPSSKAGTICADSTGRWKRLSELRINHRIHQDHLVQHAHLVGT